MGLDLLQNKRKAYSNITRKTPSPRRFYEEENWGGNQPRERVYLLDDRATLGISTGIAALLLSKPLLPVFLRFQHGALLFLSVGAGGHSWVLYFTLKRFRRLAAIIGGRAVPCLGPTRRT